MSSHPLSYGQAEKKQKKNKAQAFYSYNNGNSTDISDMLLDCESREQFQHRVAAKLLMCRS